jgi:hypothetical protein
MRYGGREEKRTVVMLVSLEPIQAPSHKERYIPLAVLISWDTSFAGDGTGKHGAARNEISSIAAFNEARFTRHRHFRPVLKKLTSASEQATEAGVRAFGVSILALLYFSSSGLPPSR